MKRVVTAALMKKLDKNTIETHGIPSLVLMERAALAVVWELLSPSGASVMHAHAGGDVAGTENWDLRRVLVVCGNGNNGGDGIAAARLLKLRGVRVEIYQPAENGRKSQDCILQEKIARSYGVRWINNPEWSEYTTIVDAIFGVGLARTVDGIFADTIRHMNESQAKILAVDISSGIDADTGQILGVAVKVQATVTFAFAKQGHFLASGAEYGGRLLIRDIGIYETEVCQIEKTGTAECGLMEKAKPPENGLPQCLRSAGTYFMEEQDLIRVPKRPDGGNKGTFGKILLVAGSEGMAGAAILSGLAVLRTGCGMVKIVTPEKNRVVLQTRVPEAMLSVYQDEEQAIDVLKSGLKWADTVGIGPGLGQGPIAEKMVLFLVENCTHPLVMDADALNLISKNKEWLHKKKCPVIITPHLGEMSRLCGKSIEMIRSDSLKMARNFASEYHLQCVLKDARTCVALPDGTAYINTTGNSGMATAGSGDVLCGIILGLLAQKTPYEYAGALAVWLHGKAGDRCSEKTGPGFLLAGDLIEELSYFRIGDRACKSKTDSDWTFQRRIL